MMKLLFFGVVFGLVGCTTASPTAGKKVPREHRAECRKVCEGLDMELSAMVIVAQASGCVCNIPSSDKANMSKASGGTSGVAGGIVMAIRAAEQQRNQSNSSSGSGH